MHRTRSIRSILRILSYIKATAISLYISPVDCWGGTTLIDPLIANVVANDDKRDGEVETSYACTYMCNTQATSLYEH